MSKILIADDNASIRYLIRFLIENAGYTVCAEAEHGTQAIEKAKELHPDLILLDLVMPGMNGAEAASILKRLIPRVPIILFTMHQDTVGKALATAVGADLVISKSDGMGKLVEGMNVLLGRTPSQPATLGPLGLATESAAAGKLAAEPAEDKAAN
jgi:CheY-like chemotaxis protein